jgi:Family of unknown function (DUF6178)
MLPCSGGGASLTHALDTQRSRDLLARLLDTPNLPDVVRGLDAPTIHAMVRACGLEDCGEIVALATPEQLMGVFDLDLWRSAAVGGSVVEEQFDPDRFNLWLEVLVDVDVAVAADKLVGLDVDFVTAAITQQLRVFDQAWRFQDDFAPVLDSAASVDVVGYTVVAARREAWDAWLAVLVDLELHHREYLGRLMQACCRITYERIADNGGLYDVLTAREQVMSDVAFDREQRREQQGYVTPAMAVAFLQSARQLRLDDPGVPPRDHVTVSYFRNLGQRSRTALAIANHVGTGVTRHEELAYLANVLVAGCSFDSRQMTGTEAGEAVLATCKLGVENWPPQWGDAEQDLVTTFRVGWTIRYEHVVAYVSRRICDVVSELTCNDDVLQDDLRQLAGRLGQLIAAGSPWRGRDHLDVLAILDTPTWAMLLKVMDECPQVPRELTPSPRVLRLTTDFEFVSSNKQIAWVRQFVERLPEHLLT